ncbi:unnamed protein product [Caenorhabditis angaria]|uniref:Globin family profile domain-containing protein n=1 Tax=Caenorhabditis angaria TaxID=860376 RepID=A0A9P1NA02_9PELO|nr:unnamed protein product [Caenorhabditis angaria]
MMGAARTTRFYKKRNSATSPATKNGAKKSSRTSSPSTSTSNSLSVPNLPLRKRSGSAPSIKIVTLATTWNLKHEQVRGIRMTWARLCEPPRSNCRGIVSLVERVWEKIDTKDKAVRNIFYNAAFVDSMNERCDRRRSGSIATLRDHTHFFVSLVSQVVQSLDQDPTKILAHLDTLGQNHAYLKKYGFKSTHWEKVGEYFVDIVVIQDCVRGFPEACRAWTMLICSVVDRLRAAPRRGSFVATMGSESRRGSACSISSEPKCPHLSGAGSSLSIDSAQPRRGSIVLPAVTVDLSNLSLKETLPPSPLVTNNNNVK